MDNENKTRTEEFTVNGDDVVAKVRELLHEGDIRRVSIRSEDGKTLLEIPLTIGVAGAAATVIFAPILAALGAMAALITKITIVVERVDHQA
jgi:hypothetical protein